MNYLYYNGHSFIKSIQQSIVNLLHAHPEWHPLLKEALACMDQNYLHMLQNRYDTFPSHDHMFAAFSLPLTSTRSILFGESPYPRAGSANGYAFWDALVDQLWSKTGLSKPVNRATSLRNLIKMLLHARGDLTHDFSQTAIASLDTSIYVQTLDDLFASFLNHGFLLLNATLVYTPGQVAFHARQWQPFMKSLLQQLALSAPACDVILWGGFAQKIQGVELFSCLKAEHPYNISFITNTDVLSFFQPFNLLEKREHSIDHR